MINLREWKRLAPLGVFLAAYTLVFLLWRYTFLYTLPFLLGLLTAMALQPVIDFAQAQFRWKRGTAACLATVLALTLVGAALLFLISYGVGELTSFLLKATRGNIPEFSPPVRMFFQRVNELVQGLDIDFLQRNQQQLVELLKGSADLLITALGGVLGMLTSLPTLLTMLLVTACSTFFIARDYQRLKGWVKVLLGSSILKQIRKVTKTSAGTGHRYLLSYALIYFISFCEAFVTLYILGLPYPLTTALLTCLADVLPVLGPGIVFGPVAVYQLLTGAYGKGLGLLIGWVVMGCVRQVIEPKLVASSTKMHPLAMLAAVYFSLAAGSIWVLLYAAGFFTLYSFLRQAQILPALNGQETPPVQQAESQEPFTS